MTQPADLIQLQNTDGGWGYHIPGSPGGGSWTEPTCWALFALGAAGLASSEAARRGSQWLSERQRSDGGWAPRDGVDQSTWVTALALLLDEQLLRAPQSPRASAWLIEQTGRDSSWTFRLRRRLLGIADDGPSYDGWPWFPGTAAWVMPTAISILALERIARRSDNAAVRRRIEQGRAYLLQRRCRDGGWNHGSTRALGYDSDSYPETTGVALLALHASNASDMASAEAVAERHLSACKSTEAGAWLVLGLTARGKRAELPRHESHGTTMEIALTALAESAIEGRNPFLA